MENIYHKINIIKNKLENLNSNTTYKYDQLCRIKYIEKSMNDTIDMLDDLELSFELNKGDELSDEIVNRLEENIKTEEIINKFTPLILAYSVYNNI